MHFGKIRLFVLQTLWASDRRSMWLFSIYLISEYCTFIYYLYVQVVIEQCEAVVKSIELQLVRVETCGCAEGYSRDGKKIIMRRIHIKWIHCSNCDNRSRLTRVYFCSNGDTKYTNRGGQCLHKSCYSNLHDISKIIYMPHFKHKQLQSW